jgi:hypothetical protein
VAQLQPTTVFRLRRLVLEIVDLQHRVVDRPDGRKRLTQRQSSYEGPYNDIGDLAPDVAYNDRRTAAAAFRLLIPRARKASFFEIELAGVPYVDAYLSSLTPKLVAAALRDEGEIGLMRIPFGASPAPYEFVIVNHDALAESVVAITRWRRRFVAATLQASPTTVKPAGRS